eukprot:TRINITY_DN7185_c0_g1_i1.p1 TRINITY_DN7185_c0_g1~~TRINITY_DN7185_c0_g1_i1.p1  ORF type:complete len:893 (+),score=128.74 TRINITY_DN7185_c0_g1_i1:91-2769(+)
MVASPIQWLIERSLHPSDTAQIARAKKVIISVVAICGSVSLISMVTDWGTMAAHWYGAIVYCLVNVVLLGYMMYTRRLTMGLVEKILVLWSLLSVIGDWSLHAADTVRVWPFILLIMDMSLAIGVREHIQWLCIGIGIIWLFVSSLEDSLQLGLYRIEGWSRPTDAELADTQCGDPPCAKDITTFPTTFGVSFAVLVVDYLVTRRFAEGMQRQSDSLRASVALAEQVTACLARFDLSAAEEALSREASRAPEQQEGIAPVLPPDLARAFQQLVCNLDSYRPYLPESLLSTESGIEERTQQVEVAETAPPKGGKVAIVFTDIQGSTGLWEQCPQGMYKALQQHNTVLRQSAATCSGYEVKTIGDSFMLAFGSPVDACRFGLLSQVRLLELPWPADLLHYDLCREVRSSEGSVLWRGLRVRTAAHYGPVRCEINPITGRFDYFGSTVNVAARVEGVTPGGLNGVTRDVLDAVEAAPGGLAALGDAAVHPLGLMELRGIAVQTEVSALLPQQLTRRLATTMPRRATVRISPMFPSATTISINVNVVPSAGGAAAADVARTSEAWHSRKSVQSSSASTSTSAHDCPERGFARTPSELAPSPSPLAGSETTIPASPGSPSSGSRFSLRLSRSRGSCAVLRARLTCEEIRGHRISNFVTAVHTAADICQGKVCCVLSACVVVTWNALATCADHTTACSLCLRFIRREQLNAGFVVHSGAASGGFLSGNVTSGRRRWVTVLGGAIELASALAEEAEMCNDLALAAGPVADVCAHTLRATRAQLWHLGDVPTVIWAVPFPTPSAASDPYPHTDLEADSKWSTLLQLPQSTDGSLHDPNPIDSIFTQAAAAAGPGEAVALLQKAAQDYPDLADCLEPLLQRARRGCLRTRPAPPFYDPADG